MREAAFAKGDIFLFDSMSNWSIAFPEARGLPEAIMYDDVRQAWMQL